MVRELRPAHKAIKEGHLAKACCETRELLYAYSWGAQLDGFGRGVRPVARGPGARGPLFGGISLVTASLQINSVERSYEPGLHVSCEGRPVVQEKHIGTMFARPAALCQRMLSSMSMPHCFQAFRRKLLGRSDCGCSADRRNSGDSDRPNPQRSLRRLAICSCCASLCLVR